MAKKLVSDTALVEVVRKYPWVYDTGDYRFRRPETRQDAWHQIGQEMNMTASQSQQRFLVIRNRYGREKKKLLDLKKPLVSDWPLFKEMRFIDPHMKYRNKKEIETNRCCSADSLEELIMTCDSAVDEKPNFLLTPSSSSAEIQPINHTNTVQNTQAAMNPIVAEAVRTEPSPAITTELIGTIQKVAKFFTEQKSTRMLTSNNDELQSFGRTIALMLTGIKDKRRQRRAMADLLMKMSEYDTDSDA